MLVMLALVVLATSGGLATFASAEEVAQDESTVLVASNQKMTQQREVNKLELQQKRDEMKAQREETMKQKRAERCEMVQKRIAERATSVDTAKEKHLAVYKNMQARIQKFIDRLSAAGMDTTKVAADLTVLQTKIQKFTDDQKAYEATMDAAKNFACGETDIAVVADAKTKMQTARAALKVVHADAADIRVFMRQTVMVDILALKKQVAETKLEDAEKAVTEKN